LRRLARHNGRLCNDYMLMDLFESSAEQVLRVEDAELVLWQHVDFGNETDLLQLLIEETPWRQEQVTVWGKTHMQPRLIAWYGDDALSYSYSGITLSALPWTPALLRIKGKVETLCQSHFNSVLVNYYRDHRDGMGLHSDDEPELGPVPVIASVTFGASRHFVLKHRHRKDIANVKLPLPSGSLLLMKGSTQTNWKHGVPKQTKPCGPRINLTFRRILSHT
jgi:alkylated DNA repair dioxygenase AlkB